MSKYLHADSKLYSHHDGSCCSHSSPIILLGKIRSSPGINIPELLEVWSGRMRPKDVVINCFCGKAQKITEFLNSMSLLWFPDNTLVGMVQISKDIQALEIKCLCPSSLTEQ